MRMDITNDFDFGSWIQKWMARKNWDIYDLAIMADMSEKTVAEYIRNTRPPKIVLLRNICECFGARLIIEDDSHE